MIKPRGCLHSAGEELFCLLVLALPEYRSLLCILLAKALLYCLLAFLLLFLARHSDEIAQVIRRAVVNLCAGLVLPAGRRSGSCFIPAVRILRAPLIAPLFMRPPPCPLASRL